MTSLFQLGETEQVPGIPAGMNGDSAMGTPYFVNLEQPACPQLSERMGMDIDGDALSSHKVSFYDNDLVMLAIAPVWQPEPTRVLRMS